MTFKGSPGVGGAKEAILLKWHNDGLESNCDWRVLEIKET